MTTVKEGRFVFDRKAAIEYLVERDGDKCMFPGCEVPFDESKPNMIRTIDHIYPQALAKAENWPFELIWDWANLQLMHKSCNAKKGHHTYDEQGNLVLPPRSKKVVKSERAAVCRLCESGRLLLGNEICEACGSEAQPKSSPKYLQKSPKECDHSTYHCWACFIGDIPRKSAIDRIIGGP